MPYTSTSLFIGLTLGCTESPSQLNSASDSTTKTEVNTAKPQKVIDDESETAGSSPKKNTQKEEIKPKKRVVDSAGLIELKESFGKEGADQPSVVPYYHQQGREATFQKINTLIGAANHGPRTFLRADVYDIMTKVFEELKSEPHIYVYGEGGWGGEFASKRLIPHKTHSKGRHLDIFMPVLEGTQPVYFPTTEANLFGYKANFSAKGKGQGEHKNLGVDWPGLQSLIVKLCTHGGTKLRRILIAQDMFSFVTTSANFRKELEKIPKTCQKKITPIGPIGPYRFAGYKMMVDHDDHIHVEFK